jgi:luciferase family oxidoreductase group 1
MRLSVLDQSPVRSGGTAAESLQETIELAQLCDRLGFHRYWLAEHHATPALAGSSPEILIGQVAARTSRIRVGSGGVMLQHYSPFKVAEHFALLQTLFPGRIDLGIGRAPGSDQLTARALRPTAWGHQSAIDDFPDKIADLVGHVHGTLPPDHAFARVRVMPAPSTPVEIWLLGSTDQSAALAAHFGTGFSFAHFINADGGAAVTRAYAQAFQPVPWLPAPRASAGVFVVCADTEAEAQRLARSRELFIAWLYTGRSRPYPSPEEAERYPYDARERAIVAHARARSVAGAPEQVQGRLLGLAAEYGVDELVVVTITHDPKARRRSYELLAQVFELA